MNFIIKKKGSETMSFQENLRYYREKAGYKQAKDFAEVLNIPYSTYTGYEVRNREPKYETLCKIADLLHVSTDDLLGRTTNILGNKDDKQIKQIISDVLSEKTIDKLRYIYDRVVEDINETKDTIYNAPNGKSYIIIYQKNNGYTSLSFSSNNKSKYF